MAAEASEAVEPDYVSSKRPSRSIYIFHQALKTLLYVFLVILVFVLAITWTLVITFSIVPIILWKRGYHKVLEYYCAPFELQRDLFRSYRGALKTGKAEWDFEKGRPEPIALLERGFKSHEERIPAPQKSLFLSLPAELRLKIYKELVIGNGSLYCVSVHRSKRPGDKRSTCLIQGHICSQDLQRAPTIDCNCFDLRHHDSCRRLQREVASVVQGVGLSGLSRTCKQTYLESIDLLYSQYLSCPSRLLPPPPCR